MIDGNWMSQQEGGDGYAYLFSRPMAAHEIATCREGVWGAVTDKERVWMLTREGVMAPDEMEAWIDRLAKRTPELPKPKCRNRFECSAYANGCENIAYKKAPMGQGGAASLHEVKLQVEDAMLVLLCGVGTKYDAKPMEDGRYD